MATAYHIRIQVAHATWRQFFSDLYRYGDLFLIFLSRELQIRYAQTALGVAWALLQPVGSMLAFWLVFGKFAQLTSGSDIPYPLFCLVGTVSWTFFAASVTSGSNSLISNSSILEKVYFPRCLLPAANVFSNLIDFGIAMAFTLAIAWLCQVPLSLVRLLLVIPLSLALTVFALSLALLGSAINIHFRDFRHALPFLIQIGLFLTPVIFPSTLVPEKFRWLIALNPVAIYIDGLRSALFGGPLPWNLLAGATALTLAALYLGLVAFRKVEIVAADLV